MKKISIILAVIFLLTSCASPMTKKNMLSPVSKSHTAVMGISAFFYCANGHWPKSIEEMNLYEQAQQTMSHVEITWEFIKENSVYENEPTYSLVSYVPASDSEVVDIVSGQSAPKCDGNNVQLQGSYVNFRKHK